MTTSVNGAGRQRIALDRIAIPGNVRDLDADHVDALAASIKLRGLLVPVIVRRLGDDFELIAGFHRFAAHKSQLGESTSTSTSATRGRARRPRDREHRRARSLTPTRRPVRSRRCSPTASPRTAPRRRSAGRRRGSPRG